MSEFLVGELLSANRKGLSTCTVGRTQPYQWRYEQRALLLVETVEFYGADRHFWRAFPGYCGNGDCAIENNDGSLAVVDLPTNQGLGVLGGPGRPEYPLPRSCLPHGSQWVSPCRLRFPSQSANAFEYDLDAINIYDSHRSTTNPFPSYSARMMLP